MELIHIINENPRRLFAELVGNPQRIEGATERLTVPKSDNLIDLRDHLGISNKGRDTTSELVVVGSDRDRLEATVFREISSHGINTAGVTMVDHRLFGQIVDPILNQTFSATWWVPRASNGNKFDSHLRYPLHSNQPK